MSSTLKNLDFIFHSNSKEYDRSDSFPFDYEPNGIPFGSRSKGKLSVQSFPFQFERKKNLIFSVIVSKTLKNIANNGTSIKLKHPSIVKYHYSALDSKSNPINKWAYSDEKIFFEFGVEYILIDLN